MVVVVELVVMGCSGASNHGGLVLVVVVVIVENTEYICMDQCTYVDGDSGGGVGGDRVMGAGTSDHGRLVLVVVVVKVMLVVVIVENTECISMAQCGYVDGDSGGDIGGNVSGDGL